MEMRGGPVTAVGRLLVEPEHVRHRSIKHAVESTERVLHERSPVVPGINRRRYVRTASPGRHPKFIRPDRRCRNPADPVTMLANEQVRVERRQFFGDGIDTQREFMQRKRWDLVEGINLTVRMTNCCTDLRSTIFELEHVGNVVPGTQLAIPAVPQLDDVADAGHAERGEGRVVGRRVEQHFGSTVGKLRPAVLEPQRRLIRLRRLKPAWTKRATRAGQIGSLLTVGVDHHDVAGQAINPRDGLRFQRQFGRTHNRSSLHVADRTRVNVDARTDSVAFTGGRGTAGTSVRATASWRAGRVGRKTAGMTADLNAGRKGPLAGFTLIELAGIGPGPFAGMLFSDMGATVIRVDRSQSVTGGDPAKPPVDVSLRGRHSIGLDLKSPQAIEVLMRLVEKSDGLFEGFRPGVTERLGIGPDDCLARNPKLVYGRMTGWGQEGPYALAAGHDINYISLAGALEPIGRAGQAPLPPLNLVGDFGGGGMFLAFGVVCALLEAQRTGTGQVVDAAMVDGASTLMAMFHSMTATGMWQPERGTNLLDTGAHFYDVYECSDGKYISIGSIEPQFYAELRRIAGLDGSEWDAQMKRAAWPDRKTQIAAVFKTKSRDEWCGLMEHTDVCFAPVLSLTEAPQHPHAVARKAFTNVAGLVQPSPAPRFSRTPGAIQSNPAHPGQHTDEVLAFAGYADADIASLRSAGAVK